MRDRLAILNDNNIHAQLIARGAWLGAYVLMPDHLHAFVVIDDARLNLSAWVKSLKNALSKTLRM